MMVGARYGHIVKHLEPSHVDNVPILNPADAIRRYFNDRVARIVDLRDAAHAATLEAESHFESVLGRFEGATSGEDGFSVRASDTIFRRRHRFDALPFNPNVAAINKHLAENGHGFTRVRDSGYRLWLFKRFKRIPAESGVPLLDSSDLFEVNPDTMKRIADGDFGDPFRGRVESGWLLLACSGQVYGLNGSLALSHEAHREKIISNHIIRIAPSPSALLAPGYLLTALSHPTLGRPIVKALVHGSSVPEIDISDVQELDVVRLDPTEEQTIADLAEQSAKLYAQADLLENEVGSEAEGILTAFLAGER
jgi:hypothetical protein